MSKVFVLYYSAYGQIEAMANALAEGAREAGADDDIKRVPELVSEGIVRKSHYELDQHSIYLRKNSSGDSRFIQNCGASPSQAAVKSRF